MYSSSPSSSSSSSYSSSPPSPSSPSAPVASSSAAASSTAGGSATCALASTGDILSKLLQFREPISSGLDPNSAGLDLNNTTTSSTRGGGGGGFGTPPQPDVEGMSDLEIAAILGDIMIAGGGSTGDGIATTLWQLSLDPHLCARVRAEVDQVLGDHVGGERAWGEVEAGRERGNGGRRLGLDVVKLLPLTTSVVKEVLRRSAFASVTFRVAAEAVLLNRGPAGQICIPPGAGVIMSPQFLGQDPDNWGSPYEFKPERFLPGRDFENREAEAGGGDDVGARDLLFGTPRGRDSRYSWLWPGAASAEAEGGGGGKGEGGQESDTVTLRRQLGREPADPFAFIPFGAGPRICLGAQVPTPLIYIYIYISSIFSPSFVCPHAHRHSLYRHSLYRHSLLLVLTHARALTGTLSALKAGGGMSSLSRSLALSPSHLPPSRSRTHTHISHSQTLSHTHKRARAHSLSLSRPRSCLLSVSLSWQWLSACWRLRASYQRAIWSQSTLRQSFRRRLRASVVISAFLCV